MPEHIQEQVTGSVKYFYIRGTASLWGLWIKCGDDMAFGSIDNDTLSFYTCIFEQTGSGDHFSFGDSHSSSGVNNNNYLESCQFKFSSTNQYILIQGGILTFKKCSLYSGSSVPVDLINIYSGARSPVELFMRDCDFNEVTADIISWSTSHGHIHIERCHFGTGFNLTGGSGISEPEEFLDAYSTGDDTEYYSRHYENYWGRLLEDTANYRDATYDGTNGYSYQLTSSANARYSHPFRVRLATIWISANPTVAIEFIHEAVGGGGSGDLTDQEFWIEIDSNDSTDTAQGNLNIASRLADPFATAADHTNSAESWTETLTGEVKQKISESITCAAGLITVWGCLSLASTTVYVCPKIDVS